MLIKKNIQLPNDFKPTPKQKWRIQQGYIVRRCQNCGKYFTTKPEKNQFYCHLCQNKNKAIPPS